jgi:ubiquinone/menaquinone biosynthesis C-methylase UbiE
MTSTAQHSQVVQKQFGEQAAAYLSSAVHAQGTEFALLQAELTGQGEARVLDLGCGAGHVSFHVASLVKEVVAYDLSQQMLDVVAAAALDRGISNISTVNGAAERLPFADGEFDFVFSRYSAHHWSDLGLALREVRRVLKPGGVAAFVDVLSPGSPFEWLRQVSEAGLHVRSTTRQRLRLEYSSWVERMRTPEVMRAAIRQLQQSMGNEVREYFEIDADGSFSTDVIVLMAER